MVEAERPEARDTILILEDDPGIALLESRRLKRAGYDVLVAETPEQALDVLRGGSVSLLLLDYKLSGRVNGLEFYNQLRSTDLSVPSILITGFSDEAILTEAIRVGIRDFLPKSPTYLEFLIPRVERVLDQVRTENRLIEEQARVMQEQAARAEAEAAGRRKDQFLTMLAHELRNPLAAISNAVTLLQTNRAEAGAWAPGRLDEAELDWSVGVIDRQVKHLSRLLEDLLDVSRIATGKIRLRSVPVDLRDAIEHAGEAIRPMIELKAHRLRKELGDRPVRIEADPTRLEQILENLLTNAAKYTEPGGEIRITLGVEDGKAVVRVRDNGVGIDPEFLPRVFDLFIQADQSLDRSEGGLGIGLSLVRRLTELHGGEVDASSGGPGRGSEFTLRFPRLPDEPTTQAGPRAAKRATAGGLRILIIEDSVDTARSLSRLLKLKGHDVRLAADGLQGIEAAAQFRPEVVILDVGLPGIDGIEVARRLRQPGANPEALLIAASGYGQDDDRRRSVEVGIDHYLVKPIDFDQLVRLLERPR